MTLFYQNCLYDHPVVYIVYHKPKSMHFHTPSPAPPPSPQSAMVDIISTSSLTVSWISPSDATNVRGYMFTVTGDCGDCEDTTFSSSSKSVSCSGWTASGQTCSFEVRTVSQDCGFSSTATLTSVVLSGESVFILVLKMRYCNILFSSFPSIRHQPDVFT